MKAPILEDHQWEQIISSVDSTTRPTFYRALMLIVRDLGLRPCELAALRWDMIKGQTLVIPSGYSKGMGGGDTMPLSSEHILALYELSKGETGCIFRNKDGNPFTALGMTKCISRFMRRAIGFGSAYCGRRTAAQRILDRTGDITYAKRLLRHAHVQTTMNYVGRSEAALREAMYA